jgi:large subunit ribosomal protein L5
MTERRSNGDATVDEAMVAPDELEEQPVAEAEAPEPEAVVEAAPVTDPVDNAADAADAAADDATEPAAEPAADDASEPAVEAVADDLPEPAPEVDAESDKPIAAGVAERVGEPASEPAPERAPKGREPKAAAPAEPEAPLRHAGPSGLQLRYRTDVIPALVKQFEYANPNQVPRVQKIVVNIGLGEALTNAKAIDAASSDLTMITGQKPIVMKARRSIAQFKIRTGNPIGLKVTLRGQRMWDFLERMTMLALPRIRDFRGTPGRSFDGRGNYTLGLREQIAFPEIDYDKVDRLRGLEVSIVTTAKSDEESKRLLELLGMPFAS